MKLETALMMANVYRNPKLTGMPGIEGIPYRRGEILEFKPNQDVTLFSKKPRATAYESVTYRPSLDYLGIVSSDDSLIEIRNYGKVLAEIYDNRLRKYPGYELLISPEEDSIKWKRLMEMSDAMSLETISMEERNVFVNIIEQNETHAQLNHSLAPRLQTALMILDILRKHKVEYDWDLLSPLWLGDYKPAPVLADIAGGWHVIEARRYYQFSIETLLAGFLAFLESPLKRSGRFEEYANHVTNGILRFRYLDKSQPFADLNLGRSTLGELHQKMVSRMLRTSNIEERLIEQIYELNEEDRSRASPQYAIDALLLLFVVLAKCDQMEGDGSSYSRRFLHDTFDIRDSLLNISQRVKAWLDLPLRAGIQNLVCDLSLRLHVAVSQQKWMTAANFSFRFMPTDEGGYRLEQTSHPTRTNNKIIAFIYILRDLGFCKVTDNAITITRDGRDYLRKHGIVD